MSSSSTTLSSSIHRLRRQGARLVLTAAALGVTVMLAACGGGKEGATQVAAKVNKDEISVHQINFLLQRQRGIKPEMIPAASRRILDGLVDQELAIQQAVEQKLDRDPRVVAAVEAARRDIISRAYADRVAEGAAKPTPEEIKQYYTSKPALFAQRRVFGLHEFGIEVAADQREALAAKLQGVRNADELASALRAANIKFVHRAATQPAENVPLGLLDKLAAANEGQSVVIGTPAGLNLVLVSSIKSAPVTEDQAKPAIEQFLLNDRKRKLVTDEMKRLRDAAKIEYQGQFAQAPAGAASGVEAPAVAPTPAASQ